MPDVLWGVRTSMKTFLVTGGCGFIGSHLVERLDADNFSTIVVDDLSSGYRENLAACSRRVQLHISTVEELDFDGLGQIDGVFHLAAQASVPYSIDNFYESTSTNLRSTVKVIDYCSRYRVSLVYASSSAVYGNLPLGAEQSGVDLLSPYATDKLVAEIYCAMAHKLYMLRSYGLRFFNVYGPRQDPKSPYSGVISIFADRMLKNLPIYINGGYQTRDFIYVKDVVEGLLQASQYLQANNVATYSNLLTGSSVSIDYLSSRLAEILNVVPERIYRELPPGDPETSLGTTDRMIQQLGVSEMTPLLAGLNTTVDWMRGQIEEP